MSFVELKTRHKGAGGQGKSVGKHWGLKASKRLEMLLLLGTLSTLWLVTYNLG